MLTQYKGAGLLIIKRVKGRIKVLLGRRWWNEWTIPGGGHKRIDKTLWHTAKRETIEELGSLPAFNYIDSVSYNFFNLFVWRTDIIEIDSRARRYPKQNRLDFYEFCCAYWFDLYDLPRKVNILLYPAIDKLKTLDKASSIAI